MKNKLIILYTFVIIVFTCVRIGIAKSDPTIIELEEAESMRPGGYSPIDMNDTNERVLEVAQYAIQKLSMMQDGATKYSFLTSNNNNDNNNNVLKDRTANQYSFKVVQAYQQVVAGMNYKMIIAIFDKNNNYTNNNNNNNCLGAFAVTVYDQFGTLSVTTWGREIPCSEISSMLVMKQDERMHSNPLDSDFN